MSFESLGLSAELLRAIADAGYTTPTPIQEKAIPVVLAGRDVMGIAQTGTGKTAGFTLPMIQKLASGRAKARMPRSLILEPTRELAAQVAESFEKYGKYHKLSMALLIGGVSYEDQDMKITRGVDVLIATPGRLLDHFERGKLLLTGVSTLVIDEADRMLDMGFIPDIERITKMLPFTRQTLFFSATMPPEITRLADQFLSNPERIEASRPATAATTIEQKIVGLPSNDPKLKREALRRIIRGQTVSNGIIFCNRKTDVDIVYKSLTKHGFSVAALHGDLPQPVRTKTLESFRAGSIQLLCASDVAARGLDIPAVSHVFNFDVPIHADDYVHRIGRTGRAGRQGHAFMLAGPHDFKYVAAIEKLTGKKLEREEMTDIEVAPDTRPRGDRERGRERDGKRGRGRDRDRSRHRGDVPYHDQVASMEPVDTALVAAAPAVEPAAAPPREDKPRHERPRRERDQRPPRTERKEHGERPTGQRSEGQRGERQHAKAAHPPKEPRPARPEAAAKPERRHRRDDRPERDEPAGPGMGAHTPAFLMRPVPGHLIKRKKESETV
ncbi:MAG: DEAD/DEAH box helicase [Alphaproteobacteria bacterium]|nr:DEAD/DEAH box helicase [Alphaproteobacteria bacterium]